MLEVLGEGVPGLGELGLGSTAFGIIVHVVVIASHLVEFVFADAGYDDCVETVVCVAVARLLFVFFLYAPHLAKIGCDWSFDAVYLPALGVDCVVEVALEVEGGVFRYEPDAGSLA